MRPFVRPARVALVASTLTAALIPVATATAKTARASAARACATKASATTRFFSPNSFWNQSIDPGAALDRSSAGMVSNLSRTVNTEIAASTGPWFNARHDGVAIYFVGPCERTVRVKLDHAPDAALASAWSAVPLPASAQPSSGDNDLAVWQPSTDRLWEFFQLHRAVDGWHAEWGGAIRHVSSNAGVYGTDAWPGAKPWWGVTATSFSVAGGVITANDLAAAKINHAVALVAPNVRYRSYVTPAQRNDGSSTARCSIPEGAHLRLDPSLNLARLHLPPLTRMIAEAAQRYGIIVRDYSPAVAFVGQDPTNDPHLQSLYVSAYQGMYSGQLMAAFPWSHLQVLRMNLHNGW